MTISNEYINCGYATLFNDGVTLFENYCDSCMNKVYQAIAEYKASTDNSIYESLSFYKSNLLDDVVFEDADKAKKNLFEKIGAQFIAICKKFIEFIDHVIDRVKDIIFSTKDNEKKLNILIKKHPELAKEKIQIMCSEGALDFSEIKSLAQLDKEFDQIIKMSEKADADPKTLKGKLEKIKEKWLNSEDGKIVKAGKVAGGAAAVITLGLLASKFVPEVAKYRSNLVETKNKHKIDDARNVKELLDSSRYKNQNYGEAQIKLDACRMRKGLYAQAIGKGLSTCQKINNAVARVVDKFWDKDGEKAKAYISNIEHAKKMADEEEIEHAMNSEYGKKLGEKKYLSENPPPAKSNNSNNGNKSGKRKKR